MMGTSTWAVARMGTTDDILRSVWVVPCNSKNYDGKRDAKDIRYLVYHYTGNDGDHDTGNAEYYRDHIVESSAHYFVDDDSITRSVDDLHIAWAVGGKMWRDCAQTGGGKLHGIVTNANSLSIEMCDTRRDGTYNVTDATAENALALGRMLMKKYNIPIERVVRHFDVTGKHCPAYFMDNDKWEAFKERLKEDDMETEKRYNTLREISDACPWATETVAKLIDRGAIRGAGIKDEQGRPADMDLTFDMLRLLVINDRAGCYGE